MIKKFLVFRMQKMRVAVPTLIEVASPENFTEEAVRGALREAVTQWVRNTETGKTVYGYAGDDLNIGDIAEYMDEISEYLPEWVEYIEFIGLEPASNWTYDTPLCDPIPELDDEDWPPCPHPPKE